MQLRVRISIPLPQDTLHGFATDQLDHPPGIGQGFFEHFCCFLASPWQDRPLYLGAGFVQVRERISTPLPQETLHDVDTDQLDQPP